MGEAGPQMIGGYLYSELDAALDARLRDRLGDSCARIEVGDRGYLFHDQAAGKAARLITENFIALSGDPLVATDPSGEYRELELSGDFAEAFSQDPGKALDRVANNFRMAAVLRQGEGTTLFLASNRAGSGRISYYSSDSGVLFCSDLRFLLQVVPLEVSRLAIYSILKYGAIPEPLTLSSNIRAVPPSHYVRHEIDGGAQTSATFFRLRFPCEGEARGERSDEEILAPSAEALQRSSRFLAAQRPAILLSGGIDSSLYGCYLSEACDEPLQGFYCAFGEEDPELEQARRIADRIGAELHIARMEKRDALQVLDDVTRFTDHPFSDFSSLPIAFLLRYARERMGERALLVECNGGDDCFGFADLGNEPKFTLKHRFPRSLKRGVAAALGRFGYWKWQSHEGILARLSALSDAHERRALDYFYVLTPKAYLGFGDTRNWDAELSEVMEQVFSGCGEDYDGLGYEAKTTIRQLIQVNSRRWAAKALSVGESLGIRVVYPYIWREILLEQGKIPWSAKIRDGVVKWPLKRLLESYMPESFIYRKKSGFVPPFATWLTHQDFNERAREVLLDRQAAVTEVVPRTVVESLLADARQGRKLRHAILNFLWGALFTELWIQEHGHR
jgi:asparagine synthase (glutamine-hydrolysing)